MDFLEFVLNNDSLVASPLISVLADQSIEYFKSSSSLEKELYKVKKLALKDYSSWTTRNNVNRRIGEIEKSIIPVLRGEDVVLDDEQRFFLNSFERHLWKSDAWRFLFGKRVDSRFDLLETSINEIIESPNHTSYEEIYDAIKSFEDELKSLNKSINNVRSEYTEFQEFIRSSSFERLEYLERVINLRTKGIEYYVDLFSKENIPEIENIGVEILPDLDFSLTEDEYQNIFLDSESLIEDEAIPTQRVENILNIAGDTQRFVLVGPPGSGKSTALRKIAYTNALKLRDTDESIRIPVFISAKYYNYSNKDFLKLISLQLRISIANTKVLMVNGRLQVLVDGINEIDSSHYLHAVNELNDMMDSYHNAAFIVTSRKYGFINRYGIREFELKEFTDDQIKEYLKLFTKNYRGIWLHLQKDKDLLKLAYNPMMLFMIASRFSEKKSLPHNRGQLFNWFTKNILFNEYEKNAHVIENSGVDKHQFLHEMEAFNSSLAFQMKRKGVIQMDKRGFFGQLKSFSLSDKIDVLAHNPILSIESNIITYIHHSFLDYYAGLCIKDRATNLFDKSDYSLTDLSINLQDIQWYEPVLHCGDLLSLNKSSQYLYAFIRLLIYKKVESGQRQLIVSPIHVKYEKGRSKIKVDYRSLNWKAPSIPFFHFAGKIAYLNKALHPDIYHFLEMVLVKYQKIWVLNYLFKKSNSSLYEIIVAIASLSSSRLIRILFTSIVWREIWLFNYDRDVAKGFVEHLSDFEFTVDLLDGIVGSAPTVEKRVLTSILEIRRSLYSNASSNVLKLLYTSGRIRNHSMLKFIGRSDLKFYSEHLDYDKFDIDEVLEYLIKKSVDPVAVKCIGQIMTKYTIDDILKLRIFSIVEANGRISILSELICNELQKSKSNYRKGLLDILARTKFNDLSKSLQEVLLEIFNRRNRNVRSFESWTESLSVGVRKSKTKKGAALRIKNLYMELVNELTYDMKVYLDSELIPKVYLSFMPIGLNTDLKYSMVRRYQNNELASIDAFIRISPVYNIDENSRLYLRSGKEILFEIIDEKNRLIEEKMLYHMVHPYIPFIVFGRSSLLDNINMNDTDHNINGLIEMLNMVHLFHMRLEDVVYYHILGGYERSYYIFDITNKIVFNNLFRIDDLDATDKIFVREQNGKFYPIRDQSTRDQRIGFSESQIVRYDFDKKEGHIRMRVEMKDNYTVDKDFYFVDKACDYTPELGDIVWFLPSINKRLSSFGYPMAYKISRVDKCPICKVKSYSIVEGVNGTFYYGTGLDSTTKEELTFKTPVLENMSLKVGEDYQYVFRTPYNVSTNKLIKLLLTSN